ncbi:MAG: hypothetical protein JRI68_21015 [Deltaproteobacteria bacterium]|nr:hypothetical protein [Deltaproteobacteria bacterium]
MVAWGPLKNSHPVRGIGFVVPLRDPSGRLCRGYVSHQVVRTLACDYHGGGAEPPSFPAPVDVVAGLCHVDQRL